MKNIFPLFRLQQTDILIDQSQTRIKKIDIFLSKNKSLLSAQNIAIEALKGLQDVQKTSNIIEKDVQSIKIKIELNQASLYGGKIHNPKELQDLQLEYQSLQKQLSKLEDQLLENMIIVEEKEKIYQSSLEEVQKIEAHSIQRSSELRGEQSNLKTNLERQILERETLVNSIEPQGYSLYEQIRKKKGGISVSRLQDNACSACGATLSASLVHSVQTSTDLVLCSDCGRILYAG